MAGIPSFPRTPTSQYYKKVKITIEISYRLNSSKSNFKTPCSVQKITKVPREPSADYPEKIP
jgi:hypothetical protein